LSVETDALEEGRCTADELPVERDRGREAESVWSVSVDRVVGKEGKLVFMKDGEAPPTKPLATCVDTCMPWGLIVGECKEPLKVIGLREREDTEVGGRSEVFVWELSS